MKKGVIAVLVLLIIVVGGGLLWYKFLKQPEIEAQFFTAKDAEYYSDELPKGQAVLLDNLRINSTVINGGANLIRFTSTESLKNALVAVKNLEGYLQIPLKEVAVDANNLYSYSIELQLSQKLQTNFDFQLVLQNNAGQYSTVNETPIKTIAVGSGSLQISLTWNEDDDVDLHVFEPDGTVVAYYSSISLPKDMDKDQFYFERDLWLLSKHTNQDPNTYTNTLLSRLKLRAYLLTADYNVREATKEYIREQKIPYSGELDLDSNAACYIDGKKNENVYYAVPEKGTYTIKVDLYARCAPRPAGTQYTLSVHHDGKLIPFEAGASNSGSFESTDQPKELRTVGTFTIN